MYIVRQVQVLVAYWTVPTLGLVLAAERNIFIPAKNQTLSSIS